MFIGITGPTLVGSLSRPDSPEFYWAAGIDSSFQGSLPRDDIQVKGALQLLSERYG